MPRPLLVLLSAAAGLVISWTLYAYVVGSIGPVELIEVLLLAIPIAVTLDRLARHALAALRRARLPAPAPRRAGSAPRSR
jgi:hypothetical protein